MPSNHPFRQYLVSGTAPSHLSSFSISTVLDPEEEWVDGQQPGENIFQKLDLLRPVAQKVLESIGNERNSVARPARDARDLLKQIDDEDLAGLF